MVRNRKQSKEKPYKIGKVKECRIVTIQATNRRSKEKKDMKKEVISSKRKERTRKYSSLKNISNSLELEQQNSKNLTIESRGKGSSKSKIRDKSRKEKR